MKIVVWKQASTSVMLAALVLLTTLLVSGILPVMAGSSTNVGKHAYKVNIIGRPNDWQGSDTGSESKTVFISIKVFEELVECEPLSGVTPVGEVVEAAQVEPGQRIHFYQGSAFDVVDRDATDGKAVISIPYKEGGYDIFVRVLGGSNKNFAGCLDADAYKFLYTDASGSWYYYIGHLDVNRSPGKPTKVNVKELFYDPTGTSYFTEVWSDYFWTIQNNGLRNMQLIFYG